MSEELDRRIAVEIMEEEEPSSEDAHKLFDEIFDDRMFLRGDNHSLGRNWRVGRVSENSGLILPEWRPLTFSSSLEEVLRTVDKYFAETQPQDSHHEPEMFMEYRPYANAVFCASLDGEFGLGQTLPEAICNLLLALKEEGK